MAALYWKNCEGLTDLRALSEWEQAALWATAEEALAEDDAEVGAPDLEQQTDQDTLLPDTAQRREQPHSSVPGDTDAPDGSAG